MTGRRVPRRAAKRRRGWILPVAFVAVVALVGGGAWFFLPELKALWGEDPRVDTGAVVPRVAATPTPVLAPLTPPATPLDAAGLTAAVNAVPRGKLTDVGIVVQDAATGTVLVRQGAGTQTPASTMKVLSSLVALDVLGPDARFATKAVRSGAQVVLVGGGDPLLTSATAESYPERASLQRLATQTAAALKASGTSSVTLGYDASVFAAGWHPEWPETFKWSVAPITGLTADHGRPDPNSLNRVPDPARYAADAFAALLAKEGIAVTATGAAKASADAVPLALVESPTVATIVEQTLLTSDNDAAQTLTLQIARAKGQPATFAASAAVLTAELQARGLWATGMHVSDGNGISAANQVTPEVLASAVRQGTQQPRLRALVTGLPVAGVSGTLEERFERPEALAARGVVRAKTGTIRGVNALAGYLVTAGGRPVTFGVVLNDTSGNVAARAYLDAVTSVLASYPG